MFDECYSLEPFGWKLVGNLSEGRKQAAAIEVDHNTMMVTGIFINIIEKSHSVLSNQSFRWTVYLCKH